MAVVSDSLAEFSWSSGTQLPCREIWLFSGLWKDNKLLHAETDPCFSTVSRIFCIMLVSTGILARFYTWVAAGSFFALSSPVRSITLVDPSTSLSASSFVPESNICWTTAFIFPFSLVRREASLTSDAKGNTFVKQSNYSSNAWRREGQRVTLVAVIGGFWSDLSITRMSDGNFGDISTGVLFSKVAYQWKRW